MTRISEPNYSVELPGEWTEQESAEPGEIVYASADGRSRLVVILLSVKPLFAIADQQRLLNDYMSHRSRFEAGQVPTLQATTPISSEQDGRFVGGWAAKDFETGGARLHQTVLAGTLLADFMYESSETDDWKFAEVADAVLRSIAVTPPEPAA